MVDGYNVDLSQGFQGNREYYYNIDAGEFCYCGDPGLRRSTRGISWQDVTGWDDVGTRQEKQRVIGPCIWI